MKTYVITLSQFFPVGHSQSGNETNFKYEFLFWGNAALIVKWNRIYRGKKFPDATVV